jgi:hypothetical protein
MSSSILRLNCASNDLSCLFCGQNIKWAELCCVKKVVEPMKEELWRCRQVENRPSLIRFPEPNTSITVFVYLYCTKIFK